MKWIIAPISIVIVTIILIILSDKLLYLNDSIDIFLCLGSKKHIPNYLGITEKTLFGKRDIFCPKCKCEYCKYVYVEDDKSYFQHIIKPEIIEKYKCNNCGYIFR